jgi:beta-lactamase regulating signal transducer with metallopeptidase domain
VIPLRRSADRPLAVLALLAGMLLGALALFVGSQTLPYDPLVECRTTAATVVARLTTMGVMLPLAVLAMVLLAATMALVHQLWATRRTLTAVLRRRVEPSARLRRIAATAALDGRLDVVGDQAAFTFCHGLRQPRVCISTGMVEVLDDDELLAVLLHEAHHLRHRDPLKILISRTISSGLTFLPLAGALHDSFRSGKELCADADAAAAGGRLPLARALVKLLDTDRPSWPAGVLAIGALTPTEARLRGLVESDRAPEMPSAIDWIVSAALVAGIFGFSYGAAVAGSVPQVNTACAPQVSAVAAVAADLVGDAHVARIGAGADLGGRYAGRSALAVGISSNISSSWDVPAADQTPTSYTPTSARLRDAAPREI